MKKILYMISAALVLCGLASCQQEETYSDETLVKMVEEAIQTGDSRSKAVKDIAKKTGVSKNRIYALVHGG